MLGVSTTEPTSLIRLLRHRKWEQLLERLATHPHEAAATEAALRGEKATILACALRIGAPLEVVKTLVAVDRKQLLACHRLAGSVIHEALRYMVADEVFSFVFSEAIKQQEYVKRGLQSSRLSIPQFQCVHVQERRVVQSPNIADVQDDLGRTIAHLIVEQVRRRRFILGRPVGSTLAIFKKIIQAHPQLVHVTDSDGNTPLVLLASQHTDIPDNDLEDEIFQMVHYLLMHHPSTVTHVRPLPRPWRFMNLPAHNEQHVPVSSPLYFALLYGRSLNTLEVMLQAHERLGTNGSAATVTQYGELCLHVAVSLRAPVDVLHLLARSYPEAVMSPDIYGLTPIDWLWITFVVDWHDNWTTPITNLVRPSRRRHLGRDFREWHQLITDRIAYEPDRYDIMDESTAEHMQSYLLTRLRIMLQAVYFREGDASGLLHHTCRLSNLPIGMLKLVLSKDPHASTDVSLRDMSGRYPLHYISACIRGYRTCLPLGVTNNLQILTETKENLLVSELILRNPAACRQVDHKGQLPLHIAIDATKGDGIRDSAGTSEVVYDPEYADAVVHALLEAFPEGICHRDGLTRLYPWQQAAVGKATSLDTIYRLLRREPALLVEELAT